MSNIEKDINILRDLIQDIEINFEGKIKNKLTNEEIKAISNVLAEREQDKKRIQELEEENRIFALEGSRVALKLHIEENYIPKQKVKEIIYTIIDYKIPRATNNGYYYDYFIKQEYKNDFVKLFNKLLEDK